MATTMDPLQKQETTKITELSGIWPKHSRIRNRPPFAYNEHLRKQYYTLKMFWPFHQGTAGCFISGFIDVEDFINVEDNKNWNATQSW